MVDISGKVLNYDIALCEAISKVLPCEESLVFLAPKIDSKKIECSCHKLISLIPPFMQKSENKIKRCVKALEAICNYIYLIIWMCVKRVDVLHLQWLPFLEISSIEKKFLKILHTVSPKTKFYLTVHNLYPHNWNEKRKISYRKRFCEVEHFFDNFIVHLQNSKKELCSEFCIAENRVYVVPHGVFVPKNLKIIPHERGEKLKLIMYGNQSFYKGTDILLDALALLPIELRNKVYTLIVGKTSSEYLALLKQKIDDLNVDFIPEFVPEDDLNKYIMESDVIVLPYREISQSGALLLALNFEKSIIVSDLPSFRETLLGVDENVFFEKGNAKSLAGLIRKYIEERVNLLKIQKEIKKLAEIYEWKKIARIYLALIYNDKMDV